MCYGKMYLNVGPDCSNWLRPGNRIARQSSISFFHDPPTFRYILYLFKRCIIIKER